MPRPRKMLEPHRQRPTTSSVTKAICALGCFLGLALVGCNSESLPVAKSVSPRGKPAHVRCVNLTESTAHGNIGNIYREEVIAPFEMSSSHPLSPGKTFPVKITIDGKELVAELKTLPGEFATVVIGNDTLETFSSGECLTVEGTAKLDLVNLTDKTIDFKVGKSSNQVRPRSSKTITSDENAPSVEIDGAKPANPSMGPSQIWAAYALMQKGKLKLKVVSLKGSGGAVGTGPTAS